MILQSQLPGRCDGRWNHDIDRAQEREQIVATTRPLRWPLEPMNTLTLGLAVSLSQLPGRCDGRWNGTARGPRCCRWRRNYQAAAMAVGTEALMQSAQVPKSQLPGRCDGRWNVEHDAARLGHRQSQLPGRCDGRWNPRAGRRQPQHGGRNYQAAAMAVGTVPRQLCGNWPRATQFARTSRNARTKTAASGVHRTGIEVESKGYVSREPAVFSPSIVVRARLATRAACIFASLPRFFSSAA